MDIGALGVDSSVVVAATIANEGTTTRLLRACLQAVSAWPEADAGHEPLGASGSAAGYRVLATAPLAWQQVRFRQGQM